MPGQDSLILISGLSTRILTYVTHCVFACKIPGGKVIAPLCKCYIKPKARQRNLKLPIAVENILRILQNHMEMRC